MDARIAESHLVIKLLKELAAIDLKDRDTISGKTSSTHKRVPDETAFDAVCAFVYQRLYQSTLQHATRRNDGIWVRYTINPELFDTIEVRLKNAYGRLEYFVHTTNQWTAGPGAEHLDIHPQPPTSLWRLFSLLTFGTSVGYTFHQTIDAMNQGPIPPKKHNAYSIEYTGTLPIIPKKRTLADVTINIYDGTTKDHYGFLENTGKLVQANVLMRLQTAPDGPTPSQ